MNSRKVKDILGDAPAASPPTFDLWVSDQLRRLYGGVAQEPIPQELLDLLIQIDPKSGKTSEN